MSTITVKKCDLCSAFNRDIGSTMFVPIGDIDVCVSCLSRLKRAVECNLITLNPAIQFLIMEEK